MASKMGLYELLAPQFLLGFTFPDYMDRYLSSLGVDELRTSFDNSGVVYTGRVSFGGTGEAVPELSHRDPSGGVFDWDDVTLDFRLTIPRDGAELISDAVNRLSSSTSSGLAALFEAFSPGEQDTDVPTDYPGFRFRLELLVTALTFHLKGDWVPGMVDENYRIVPDPRYLIPPEDRDPDDPEYYDVLFVLPKMVLEYEQGDDLSSSPVFRLKSWGSSGFDAPHDLRQGEVGRMEPAIAVNENERWAFGIGQILVDASTDHTPPEILEFFGVDEAFKGLYVKSARLYYNDSNKGFALNAAINDLLISFDGKVSLETSVDVLLALSMGPGLEVGVRLYDGPEEIEYIRGEGDEELTGGRATVPQTAVVQVEVTGGVPNYEIQVTLGGDTLGREENIWDIRSREALISPNMLDDIPVLRPTGSYTLRVTVTDSAQPRNNFTQTIELTVVLDNPQDDGTDADSPQGPGERQPASLDITEPEPPAGYSIELESTDSTSAQSGLGESVALLIRGGESSRVVISNPSTTVLRRTLSGPSPRRVSVRLPDGANYDVSVTYPGSSERQVTFSLYFTLDHPTEGEVQDYINNDTTDPRFNRQGLLDWLRDSNLESVEIHAFASFDNADADYDTRLSERRLQVAQTIVENSGVTVTAPEASGSHAHGHDDFTAAPSGNRHPQGRGNDLDRVAEITGTVRPSSNIVATATLSRPDRVYTPPDTTPAVRESPRPPQLPTERPAVLRRLSLHIRLESNQPVLVELSGEIDLETKLEEELRTAAVEGGHPEAADGDLGLEDGLVEFKLNVTYDTAIRQLTETLALGAAPDDVNGLARMTNDIADPLTVANRFKSAFGALLVFAPIINSAASSTDTESAGDWIALALELAIPVAIGWSGIFRTRAVTLYGGELKFTQLLPSGEEALRWTDSAIVFDYAVEFGITIEALDINTENPLKVRYKAVGFNLHTDDGVTYQPIFDSSKGYEIDLSDPGLLNMGSTLGRILGISAARIARVNPATLELDIALKVDLGVITVDRFKVKIPLGPGSNLSIMPAGVHVDIPSTLIGSGYVSIEEVNDIGIGGIAQKGIAGGADITLVPLKVRIAANLAVMHIKDESREATAVFVSLVIEFPTPIVLWSTGLGLYGFSGLFAMNYKRNEVPRKPEDSVGPALRWLEKAKGEPTNFYPPSDGESEGESRNEKEALWVADFDHWSFGIGLILGSLDSGFILNLRGMFVLELPGPRILIFVKVKIISDLPKLGDADLTVGILGVIDLDFNLGTLTIGVLFDLSIEEYISIQLPIEIFFDFNDPRNWHLYIGTTSAPASATILNLIKARGYLMISGSEIRPFPPGEETYLPGTAIATGIEASIVFGNERIGLYLRVAAGAHLGIAIKRQGFIIIGKFYLEGELHLFIIGIEVSAALEIEAPKPTKIHGAVCGRIDLFFFEIEGCVEITIGDGTHELEAPPLVRGVYLQSHSPVLVAGQGTDRPIDCSLGDAVMKLEDDTLPSGVDLPKVPIDTVPVIQMCAAPNIGSSLDTFTEPIGVPTTLNTEGPGNVNAGGGCKVRYTLTKVALLEGEACTPWAPGPDAKRPPATWRPDLPSGENTGPGQPLEGQGANTNIDLALFSRAPSAFEHALERSTDLNEWVDVRWGDMCSPAAPPACVMWTFCRKNMGTSGRGWHLTGIPHQDPPGTRRTSPVPTDLYVEEPAMSAREVMLNRMLSESGSQFIVPAKVIGLGQSAECQRALQLPYLKRHPKQSGYEPAAEVAIWARVIWESQWINLHTGRTSRTTIFMAIREELRNDILIRELSESGKVLRERPLRDLSPVTVERTVDHMPPEWLEAGVSWHDDLAAVAEYMALPEFSSLTRLVFTVRPVQECVTIQVRRKASSYMRLPPQVLICAVEACPRAENVRIATFEAIRKGERNTIMGYLEEDGPVPLLKPNTIYTLHVGYDAESEDAEGTKTQELGQVKRFCFRTDEEPPKRLDPYILGTTPDHEERCHFYKDPVKVIYNDKALAQLFKSYGKRLSMVLRAADGQNTEIEPQEKITPARCVATPLQDALKDLIDSGALPCMGSVTLAIPHRGETLPVELRPHMAYTLDIVAKDLSGAVSTTEEASVEEPLYRRSFTTSRFSGLGELCEKARGCRVRHRALSSQVMGLLSSAPGEGTIEKDYLDRRGITLGTFSDQEIQEALMAAGEQALPAASDLGITVYWASRPGSDRYSPHIIMIDSPEPIWRTRREPVLEVAPDQEDEAFMRVVPGIKSSLEVVTQTSGPAAPGPITRYVRSTGGTRTLAFISDALTLPSTVSLHLSRTKSDLYVIDSSEQELISLDLAASAPWEDDHA